MKCITLLERLWWHWYKELKVLLMPKQKMQQSPSATTYTSEFATTVVKNKIQMPPKFSSAPPASPVHTSSMFFLKCFEVYLCFSILGDGNMRRDGCALPWCWEKGIRAYYIVLYARDPWGWKICLGAWLLVLQFRHTHYKQVRGIKWHCHGGT